MKSLYIVTLLVCLFVAGCYARCDCAVSDNACVSDCVVEANSCVTSCKGNIECYEECIDDKWPTADLDEDPATFYDVLDDDETTSNVGTATTTVTSLVLTTVTSIPSSLSASTTSANQAETSHVSLGSTLTWTGSLLFVCLISSLIAF